MTCSGEIINDIVSYEGAEIIAYDVEADLLNVLNRASLLNSES